MADADRDVQLRAGIVGADLAKAATIPSDWYRDPRILELEELRIFGATWQLVGRAEQVSEPGMFFTGTVGGEPVIIVCGRDGEVRALSNVCRHRAGPVARGEGSRRSFQCGYHGWSYSLEGQLLATTEFEGVECFRKEDVALPSFEVAAWGPLLFARTSNRGESLGDVMGEIGERIRLIDLSQFRHAFRKDWVVECNWKVYVDNYLEGYHIPIVHPGLFRELDYPNYRTETKKYYSIQHSPIRRPDRIRVDESSGTSEAQYFWVFPNLMLNVYPDNFSTNIIVPLGVKKTLTIFEWYFRDPDSADTRRKLEETVAFSDEIQLEDIGICEAVQRGLGSRTYSRGRYSVKRENGVHHFHRLLEEYLQDATA